MRIPPVFTSAVAIGVAGFAVCVIMQDPASRQSAAPLSPIVPGAYQAGYTTAERTSISGSPVNGVDAYSANHEIATSTVNSSAIHNPGGAQTQSSKAFEDSLAAKPADDSAPQPVSAAAFANEIRSASPQAVPLSVPIPLAFRPQPPQVTVGNPQLASEIQGLQKDFVAAIGGPNQNPNDPTYLPRWITAANRIDDQYHLLVGDDIFLSEQMQVNSR